MASLPPRPASQRRSSPREQESTSSNNNQSQLDRTNSEAFSATSEDSQTLLLNRRQPSRSSSSTEKPQAKPSSPSQQQAPQLDAEPRKCWICFNDETEDDPMTSEWRSPCPCVLVAHEKCLLDWIADMEAPDARRRAGGSAKVLCPQCKSEIRVVRPKSVVVEGVRAIERITGTLLVPGLFFVLGSAAYTTATFLGTHAVYEIFGMEDGYRILQPLYQAPDLTEGSGALRLANHLRHHWRLDLGLPLIPTVLIASRTTLIDSFLPFLPLCFFVSSQRHEEILNVGTWPPSAALTVALLPYVRGAYNAYYERFWLPKEQQWLKEIQPRAGESDAGNNEGNGAEDDDEHHIHEVFDDEDGAIEVEVDFDLFADWNNGGEADNNNAAEPPPVPIARGPAPPLNAPPQDDAAPAPDIPAAPARRNRNRRERNINFSTTSLADTILGALLFPSIAAAVGEALKVALPKSWVTPPSNGRSNGFLQSKWARSIVGGCLFVGVKDAVMLYVRWKMAQNHRKRRVLDYDRSKAKPKKSGTIARG